MRVLVTGGAGFIGSHLVERLDADGVDQVIVLDNLHRGRVANLPVSPRVVFHQGDIRNPEALRDAVGGCEVVFHLAAQSNVLGAVADPDYSFTTNVVGTFDVVQAARREGVRRVVFSSSREVYGDPHQTPVAETDSIAPKNAYGASKAAGEMYCRALSGNDLEIAILRLANVYGTRDRDRVIPIFIGNALRGEPLILYGGGQVVDFIWIGVVVEALTRAGFGDFVPEPVNIGSGVGITIADLAKRVLDVTGSRSQISVLPQRDVEVGRFIARVDRARCLMGIAPPDDPLAHLRDLAAWVQKQRG